VEVEVLGLLHLARLGGCPVDVTWDHRAEVSDVVGFLPGDAFSCV